MKSELKCVVKQKFDDKPLLLCLRQQLGVSATLIKKAKRIDGGITVDGKIRFTNENVHLGEKVAIVIQTDDENSDSIPLSDKKLCVLFEDEYILVVDKPWGLPTHPSSNNYGDTLGGRIMNFYKEKGQNFVFRPVTRLDKGTSGICVVAKNSFINERLIALLHTDGFIREYEAVVCGIMPKTGIITAPIAREPTSIIKRCVDENGQRAITEYEAISYFGNRTLVRLRLKSGRTHQIRVHLSYISHPIIGDFLYGTESDEISRPALHSQKIILTHPMTGKALTLESPLPNDIINLLR